MTLRNWNKWYGDGVLHGTQDKTDRLDCMKADDRESLDQTMNI